MSVSVSKRAQSAPENGAWIAAAMAGSDATVVGPLFPWRDAMDACEHDPIHHAEGSPWVHTTLVSEALERRIQVLGLSPERAGVLRLAGWAHDMGKPATTEIEIENGQRRVRQPGHAPLGARMIWQHLIDVGQSVLLARDVSALVGWHMRPTHLHEQDQEKILDRLARFSIEAGGGGWNELMALCRADQDGRISLDADRDKHYLLDVLELHMAEISEVHDWDPSTPWPFASDEARLYSMLKGGSIHHSPLAAAGSRVTVLSGLPGAGKDSWIAANMDGVEVISLDAIRVQLRISPSDNQGPVAHAALDRARELLRAKAPFVWNATNVSRVARGKILNLCRSYDAHITAVSLDVPAAEAMRRNRRRDEPVPDQVILDLARKREVIMPEECHSWVSVDAMGVETRPFDRPVVELASPCP